MGTKLLVIDDDFNISEMLSLHLESEGYEVVIDGCAFVHGEQDTKYDENMALYEAALEYFVKDGQVLLCGWGYEGFEQVDGEWFFILDGECDTKMPMEETIGNEKNLLKTEHKCLPAKFLIFYNDITDAEKFEQAKECPYFHCVFSVDEDI